ncbi:uncharacterized protein HD556DRAFT_1397597 [Suillus plorans]|uniref:Uncharacterized protein n=1 Tax=Suillus plorans TaxID=116603 RepID=A0A9P7DDY1_9AGAM|nr:uncharacterized protein HD556DRAFT_1397597 [Suillus plorans]KAG1789557.1 hypothetical protein HD556DRAFT_1397597 [Suillus plorans]
MLRIACTRNYRQRQPQVTQLRGPPINLNFNRHIKFGGIRVLLVMTFDAVHIWAYSYQTSLACIYIGLPTILGDFVCRTYTRAFKRSSVTAGSQTTDIYDPQFPAYI